MNGTNYRVELTSQAIEDFNKLDNSQQLQIKKSLLKIEQQGMMCGEPLGKELSGYRKIKHRRLGLRVVFGKAKNNTITIEVIAIGKRSDNEIYDIATRRIKSIK